MLALAIEPANAGRVDRHPGKEVPASHARGGVDGGGSRLQPDHTPRRLLEGDFGLESGVGSVIGGDGIDQTLDEGRPQSLDVSRCPKRGIHLEGGVHRQNPLVVKHEMMRRHFGGDLYAICPRLTKERHGAGGRNVLDVIADPGQSGQGEVAGYHNLFGHRGRSPHSESGGDRAFMHVSSAGQPTILGMLGDHATALGYIFHRQPKQPGIFDR